MRYSKLQPAACSGLDPAAAAGLLTGDDRKPLVAILADARGAEAPDLLAPYAILSESGAVDVRIVSATTRPIRLMAGVAWVAPQLTIAQLDAIGGPDVVIVPALSVVEDPDRQTWLRNQARGGARIMSICDGAKVLATAGLLDGREATVHWYSRARLARKHPRVIWRRDLRWVTDGPITTTAGISAAIPASLALLREMAGEPVMRRTADSLGLPLPDQQHRGSDFRLTTRSAAVVLRNRLAFWRRENVAVPMSAGLDELGFATTLDAWSRTWRSIAWATGARCVISRHGLTFIRAQTHPESFSREVSVPKPDVMSGAFEQIQHAYGKATARLVALQFEHPYGAVA